jgi:hypothetical protein
MKMKTLKIIEKKMLAEKCNRMENTCDAFIIKLGIANERLSELKILNRNLTKYMLKEKRISEMEPNTQEW